MKIFVNDHDLLNTKKNICDYCKWRMDDNISTFRSTCFRTSFRNSFTEWGKQRNRGRENVRECKDKWLWRMRALVSWERVGNESRVKRERKKVCRELTCFKWNFLCSIFFYCILNVSLNTHKFYYSIQY